MLSQRSKDLIILKDTFKYLIDEKRNDINQIMSLPYSKPSNFPSSEWNPKSLQWPISLYMNWLYATFLSPLPPIFPFIHCISHNDLFGLPWMHWRPSHLGSYAFTISTGQCSYPVTHLLTYFSSYSAVLCPLSPPQGSLLCVPMSKCAPLPMTLCFLTLFLTTCLLVYLYTLTPLLGCKLHEGERSGTLLFTLAVVVPGHKYFWVKKMNGMSFVIHL